jgi:endonuclease/exonuclease/phosphatase family metal-dependent hydrolase
LINQTNGMNTKTKKWLRTAVIIIHCFIVFLFLLVALTPFLNPYKFWFVSLLGIGYPFLIIAVFICLLITVVLKSKWFILPLAALLISWKQISVIFAFNSSKTFNTDKPATSLRVLSWNVSRWTENENSMRNRPENSYRNQMMDAVLIQNADVLCFQEFFQCYAPTLFPENIEPIKKMGYPYYYFTPSSIWINGSFQTGLMIFSRYPIVDSAFFKSVSGDHSEGFSYVDINFNNRPVRIFNTHLESPGIRNNSIANVGYEEGSGLIGKIKRAYYFRSQQADLMKQHMNASPHPVIFCGDVGDVPNSYAYFRLKKNMQDVFLKKGSGLGRTFRFISPTLRIDVILADKNFNVNQFEMPDFNYSDHLPLVTDLELK